MAIYQIDSFQFDTGGLNNEIDVFFNNETLEISAVAAQGAIPGAVTEAQREKVDGQALGNYPNAANTLAYPIVAQLDVPYARRQGEPVPITPNPPQCDLTITYLETTDEQSQGANNGIVVFSAASSFPNVEFSIDDVNYSNINLFVGLSPGNYTAYVRDSNGCKVSRPFAINPFNNPIQGGFAGGLPQVQISSSNISRWSAAYNPIVLNFDNVPDSTKKNFRIEIEITTQFGKVVGTWAPSPKGKTRADISAYLQTFVNSRDDFKYDMINYRDLNRSASFSIRYREVWDAGTSVWYSAPQPLYVTYSAKQLGDLYGGNMGEYVTFLNEPNTAFKAKFLTLFEEPTAWEGLPYDNSFILSEYLVGQQIKVRTISLDINRKPIAAGYNNGYLLNNNTGYILGSDVSRLIISQGALPPVQDDDVLDGLGINRLMLAGTPGPLVEYFQIQLFTGLDDSPNYVTQPLTIKVNDTCRDPYVYLKWLNTLGGWDYWRFGYDQIVQLNTADGIQIDRNVFDYELDDTIADTIKKTAAVRMTFGVMIPQIKESGLRGLHLSTRIQMLTSVNPIKWQTVTLQTGTFDMRRTRSRGTELKFSINLPEINIQQNGSVPQEFLNDSD